jgi:hypothetical protein
MTTPDLKKDTAIEKGEYELVKGDFSPDDAREILTHLIQQKINFHNQRSFSQFVRFGSADDWSISRIEELKQTKENVLALLEKAGKQGKTLRIKSDISIDLI